jgi:hypothetical protein
MKGGIFSLFGIWALTTGGSDREGTAAVKAAAAALGLVLQSRHKNLNDQGYAVLI